MGGSPYGAMGMRVARCPGHRQVYVGHRWARQMFEGEVLVGEPVFHYYTDEEGREVEYPKKRRIAEGEAVFGRLTELVYEAWGRGEEFWMVVENEEMSRTESTESTEKMPPSE